MIQILTLIHHKALRFSLLIASLIIALQTSALAKETEYQLKFEVKAPLAIQFEIYQLDKSFLSKVGMTANFKDVAEFGSAKKLKNNKLFLEPGSSAILALVGKNLKNENQSFAVAPHSAEPLEATLGFKFNCLCYGHTYKIQKNKLWFRIMKLTTMDTHPAKQKVILNHVAFSVK